MKPFVAIDLGAVRAAAAALTGGRAVTVMGPLVCPGPLVGTRPLEPVGVPTADVPDQSAVRASAGAAR